MGPKSRVKEGDRIVILAEGGARRTYARVRPTKRARMGKQWCDLMSLVGQPFGAELEGGSDNIRVVEPADVDGPDGDATRQRTNDKLFDDADNQKLSQQEIESLKKTLSGAEVLETVISNSATFETKSEFSKAKYMKKKKRKYLNRFVVHPASPLVVCETMLVATPRKSLHLRPDMLSLLLSYGNARSGGRPMVWDMAHGLVAAAVLERMGGIGRLLCVQNKERAGLDMLTSCQIPKTSAKCLFKVPFFLLQRINRSRNTVTGAVSESDQQASDQQASDQQTNKTAATDASTTTKPAQTTAAQTTAAASNGEADDGTARKETKDKQGVGGKTVGNTGNATGKATGTGQKTGRTRAWHQKVIDELKTPCDSLILALRANPIATMHQLFPFVAPSSPIAVYCEHIEPLARAVYWLRSTRQAVNVEIVGSFYREHQVLPSRTHPKMVTNGHGGYLLTGTYVRKF